MMTFVSIFLLTLTAFCLGIGIAMACHIVTDIVKTQISKLFN